MNGGAEGFVKNTGSDIKTRKTISIYLRLSDSDALHTASDRKFNRKLAGVRVARYCRPGKVIVRTARQSGNANGKGRRTTNERAAHNKGARSKLLSCVVRTVADREKPGIRTAQSVPGGGKKSLTGSGAGGLTRKYISV